MHPLRSFYRWVPWWLGRLSICLELRLWSLGPEIEPHRAPCSEGVCFSIGKVSFFMGSLSSAYKYVVIAPIFREKKMYLTPHPPFTTSIVDCLYSKTFQKNCPFLLSQFLSSHFSLEPTPIMLLTLYSSETALVKVTNKLCVANSKDCISTWIF